MRNPTCLFQPRFPNLYNENTGDLQGPFQVMTFYDSEFGAWVENGSLLKVKFLPIHMSKFFAVALLLPRIQSTCAPSTLRQESAAIAASDLWRRTTNGLCTTNWLMPWTATEPPLALTNVDLAFWWHPRWNGRGCTFPSQPCGLGKYSL